MLTGDWNSETKWRMYMSHLREIETVYRKLPLNQVSEHFRTVGPRGDLHFLHETVKAFFIPQHI